MAGLVPGIGKEREVAKSLHLALLGNCYYKLSELRNLSLTNRATIFNIQSIPIGLTAKDESVELFE